MDEHHADEVTDDERHGAGEHGRGVHEQGGIRRDGCLVVTSLHERLDEDVGGSGTTAERVGTEQDRHPPRGDEWRSTPGDEPHGQSAEEEERRDDHGEP